MEESNEVYKYFVGKKVRVITYSGFTFTTENIEIISNGILFKDKFFSQKFIPFSEIKFIEEVIF